MSECVSIDGRLKPKKKKEKLHRNAFCGWLTNDREFGICQKMSIADKVGLAGNWLQWFQENWP